MRNASMLVSLAWLVGCSGDPSITIVVPDHDATVCGSPLHVEVKVKGIELVVPQDDPVEDPEPGTGHVDVSLNGQEAVMSADTEFDIPAVDDAEYQLSAELSNADHTPLVPYAGDFLYLTVDNSLCD